MCKETEHVLETGSGCVEDWRTFLMSWKLGVFKGSRRVEFPQPSNGA